MELTFDIYIILFIVAFLAGGVDTIAGGGGLITLPTLLSFGVPPSIALATNKLQGTIGSFTSSIYFVRKKIVDLKQIWFMIVLSLLGSLLGGILVFYLDTTMLKNIIPVLLIIIAIYFLFSPNIGDIETKQKMATVLFSFTFVFLIGFYDGFFGPGTGSFFAIAFVYFLGYNLTRATAHAKVLNFTSNLSALVYFIFYGEIYWYIGLIMGLGQILGATIASNLVLNKGSKLIKPIIVIVSFVMSIKILME